jgi:HlyD family secretion protein
MIRKPVIALAATPLVIIVVAVIFLAMRKTNPEPQILSGTVEVTRIDMASKIPGRIDSLFIREGECVHRGQLLFKLESKEMLAKVEQAQGAMEAARAKMAMAENGLRPQEREAALKMYTQARVQYELLEKTWSRIQKLHADSVISSQESDQIEAQFTAAREQMDAAKARYEMAREGTRYEDRLAAQSLFHQAQSAYKEACAYADELMMRSPINGEAAQVIAHPGEIIASGYPIVTLMDTADIWIVVQVKETSMGQLRMGTRLSGSVPALNNARHEFLVSYVAPMADFATWRPTNQRGSFDVRTFEIHLRPSSPVKDLRPGMTVNFEI